MDSVVKMVDEQQGTGLFQYFIKVVPTIYESREGPKIITNQYSFTERFRPLERPGGQLHDLLHDHNKHGSSAGHHQATTVLPGIFWVYDFSAFMIEISHPVTPLTHFLARLCAIAGGVFTVTGLIDALIFHWKAYMKNRSRPGLGKFGMS
uniref:Endoplasmic reticulum vesicle transporter C-terminal domain-containing protein n=1 Tax=Octactis speculum TaxID=3111310 RepID=A0A7S2HLU8_9STRA